MSFTFRARSEANYSSLPVYLWYYADVNKPSGTIQGDILFTLVCAYNATFIMPPSGWTSLGSYVANNDKYLLYYKIAGSSEPSSYRWYFESDGKVRLLCACYYGDSYDSADPIDVVSNIAYRTTGTTVRAASMTVSAANSPLIFFAAVYATAVKTFTKPSAPTTSWAEDDDDGSTISDFSTEICSMLWTGSGATGNMDATCSASLSTKHAFAVALNPLGGETLYGAATMSGVGSLAAKGACIQKGAVTMSGIGSLAAMGSVEKAPILGSVTLSGTGSLAVAAAVTRLFAAALTGTGILASAARTISVGTATISGVGALAAAAVSTLVGAATVAGAGSLAAAAVKTLSGAAALSGVGSLSAIGNLLGDVFGAASLAGQGSMSVIAESWHILTAQEYQDLLEGQIEFQEI